MSHQRRRVFAVSAVVGLLLALTPFAARGAGSTAVDNAKQQLQQAQQNAAAEDTAAGAVRQQLIEAQARLGEIQRQIDGLDAAITVGRAQVGRLQEQAAQDKRALAHFLRASYEGTVRTSLAYVLAADNFSAGIQREIAATSVAGAGLQLVGRIRAEQSKAQAALDALNEQRGELSAAQQQAVTTTALISVERDKVQALDYAAHVVVTASQNAVTAAQAQFNAEQAALIASRAQKGLVFQPIPGINFTVDTDLQAPSGETAGRLNTFLKGTAFDGLGGAYVAAETKYHVSARYLLAHSIEESAFGTSALAQGKHNIFGYGADDAHPYTDAVSFPNFPTCIDFVAGKVAANYLSPHGTFFHGSTLRGMNVNYATDPSWANNIARIALSFP